MIRALAGTITAFATIGLVFSALVFAGALGFTDVRFYVGNDFKSYCEKYK